MVESDQIRSGAPLPVGIVTGNDAFAAELGASLEALGVVVRRVALESTAQARCQLVALDVDTHGAVIEAVAAAVRAGSPRARLVAIATVPDRLVLLRLLRAGAFDCIERPISTDALAEQQPQFWLKREKFSKVMSAEAPGYTVPDQINPDDYLDKLQSDDYS